MAPPPLPREPGDMSRSALPAPHRAVVVVACAVLTAVTLAGCDRDDPESDEVVIVTPSAAASGTRSGDDGTITLEAITPAPSTDDEYCTAVITAMSDYNMALQTYIDDVLPATLAAAQSNDLSGINDLGGTVNALALDAVDRVTAAKALVDDKAASEGLNGMIEYLNSYLIPAALIMNAASDFDAFNDDITAHTEMQLPLIQRQFGHGQAVKDYTSERCGVDLTVVTAG